LKKGSGYDETLYPFALPVVRNLDVLRLDSPVTFFIGENGAGKSTLLEAVAVGYGFNAEGGSRNFHFATSETHSELYKHLVLEKGVKRPKDGYFLRAESFYNVASEIDRMGVEDSYGGQSLHRRSHGESFMSLALDRFFGNGLYLLDEPEAALSPSRQLSLIVRMNELVRQGSQFLIATHSPILMAFPGARIYHLGEDGIKPVAYRDTEHHQVAKYFLNNPEGMLEKLLQPR
jgi:predicted ATPase